MHHTVLEFYCTVPGGGAHLVSAILLLGTLLRALYDETVQDNQQVHF